MAQNLGDMLLCPICMEECKQPKALPCLHTFCKLCLEMHLDTSVGDTTKKNRTYNCPSCRKSVAIPSSIALKDWIDELPLNHLYVSLKETIVTGDTYTKGVFCRHHPKHDAAFFCEDHCEELCVDCILGHRKCLSLAAIHDAIEKEKRKTQDLLQENTHFLQYCQRIKNSKQQQRENIIRDVEESRARIRYLAQVAVEEILRQENLCNQRLNNVLLTYLTVEDNKIEECDKIEKSMQADNILLQEQQYAALSTTARQRKTIQNHIVKEKKKLQKLAKNNAIQIKLPTEDELLGNFRELELFNFVIDSEVNKQYNNGVQKMKKENSMPLAVVKSKVGKNKVSSAKGLSASFKFVREPSFIKGEPNFIKNICIQQEKDKRTCKITGATYLESGLLILVDNNNGNVKVFDVEEKFYSGFTFSSKPWDVTDISENEIAITFPEDKLIQFLRVDEERLKPANGIIRTNESCYGISSSTSSIAVVCKSGSRMSVNIFGTETRKRLMIWRSKRSVTEDSKVYCCMFPMGDKLIVANEYANEITCLSVFGEVVWSCDLQSSSSGGPTYPIIIRGDIFVTCSSSTNIIHLSSDGKQVRSYFDDSAVQPMVIRYDYQRNKLFLTQDCGKADDNFYKVYHFSF